MRALRLHCCCTAANHLHPATASHCFQGLLVEGDRGRAVNAFASGLHLDLIWILHIVLA
jgi:hypothetical protein